MNHGALDGCRIYQMYHGASDHRKLTMPEIVNRGHTTDRSTGLSTNPKPRSKVCFVCLVFLLLLFLFVVVSWQPLMLLTTFFSPVDWQNASFEHFFCFAFCFACSSPVDSCRSSFGRSRVGQQSFVGRLRRRLARRRGQRDARLAQPDYRRAAGNGAVGIACAARHCDRQGDCRTKGVAFAAHAGEELNANRRCPTRVSRAVAHCTGAWRSGPPNRRRTACQTRRSRRSYCARSRQDRGR